MASRTSPLLDTTTTLGKILTFLGVSALAGVLLAGLMLPAAATVGAAANAGGDMLDQLPAELREEPLSVPSRLVSEDGELIATFYAENRQPVPLDQISQNMQDAIIAIEDERFYEHGGVDPRGLTRALVNNLTSDSTQGASTITQQYVNNVLVNAQMLRGDTRLTISGTKNIADKLREMKLSAAIEQEMTKDQILEGYLNIVLFSGRVYGVEAASQYFFQKPASDLTVPEAAMLAGMVQSPNGYNPVTNPEGTKRRRDTVLAAMLRTGKIDQQQYEEAVATPLGVDELTPLPSGCLSAEFGQYFCDYVQRQILADPAFGPDPESRQQLLDRGGLTIRTTLNSKLQKAAEEEVRNSVPLDEAEDVGAALVSVEPKTGNVRAMAQNTQYDVAEEDGHTTLNFNVDAEWGGGQGFQGGSTMKIFPFIAWVDAGHSMVDVVDAKVDRFPQGTRFEASCLDGGQLILPDANGWNINNASDGYKVPMRADYGLYWSINTATTAVTYLLDLCAITDITTNMGVQNAYTGKPINPGSPSFVLGAENVSPLTMAGAFNVMPSRGEYCTPRSLLEVKDTQGNSYPVPGENCERAVSADTVDELQPTLQAIAQERQVGPAIEYDIAGKTGTNNNESSGWFVGYSSGLTTASWVGSWKDQTSLRGATINGTYYEHLWGSLLAGPQWTEYMKKVGEEYSTEDFPDPVGPQSPEGEIKQEGVRADSEFVDWRDLDRGGPRPQGGDSKSLEEQLGWQREQARQADPNWDENQDEGDGQGDGNAENGSERDGASDASASPSDGGDAEQSAPAEDSASPSPADSASPSAEDTASPSPTDSPSPDATE